MADKGQCGATKKDTPHWHNCFEKTDLTLKPGKPAGQVGSYLVTPHSGQHKCTSCGHTWE